MKNLVLCLVLIITSSQLSAKDWNILLNLNGTDRSITSFDYLDSSIYCIFTSDYIKIDADTSLRNVKFFITKDAGKTWDSSLFESYYYYQSFCLDTVKSKDSISYNLTKFPFVRFIDQNTIIAIGDFSIVLKSTDAGKSWDTLRHRNMQCNHFNHLNFDKKGRGHLYYPQNERKHIIHLSDDFAVTQYVPSLPDTYIELPRIYNCFRFGDSIFKFIIINHENWSYNYLNSYDKMATYELFEHFNIITGETIFLSPEEGYFLGYPSVIDNRTFIYRTNDGGKSWKLLVKPTNKLKYNNTNIVRINNNILVATDKFYIKTSYDDGYNWIVDSVTNVSFGNSISDFRIIDNKLFCKDNKAVYYMKFDDIINSVGASEISDNILNPYPNPIIFGKFNIDCNPDLISSIILYDINGKSFSLNYDNIKYGITAYIPDFISSGIYYLRIIDIDGNIIKSSPIIVR